MEYLVDAIIFLAWSHDLLNQSESNLIAIHFIKTVWSPPKLDCENKLEKNNIKLKNTLHTFPLPLKVKPTQL